MRKYILRIEELFSKNLAHHLEYRCFHSDKSWKMPLLFRFIDVSHQRNANDVGSNDGVGQVNDLCELVAVLEVLLLCVHNTL